MRNTNSKEARRLAKMHGTKIWVMQDGKVGGNREPLWLPPGQPRTPNDPIGSHPGQRVSSARHIVHLQGHSTRLGRCEFRQPLFGNVTLTIYQLKDRTICFGCGEVHRGDLITRIRECAQLDRLEKFIGTILPRTIQPAHGPCG